jgi:hypothetical protein
MKLMTASLLTLVLVVPAVHAAPAPDRAKEKLEAMKNKLPEVVTKWGEVNAPKFGRRQQAKLRLVRQVGPTEAKVNVLVWSEQSGDLDGVAVTIFLRYYQDSWTTTRYEGDWGDAPGAANAARVLMLLIDELGEK